LLVSDEFFEYGRFVQVGGDGGHRAGVEVSKLKGCGARIEIDVASE
jgi:hypothetical protein